MNSEEKGDSLQEKGIPSMAAEPEVKSVSVKQPRSFFARASSPGNWGDAASTLCCILNNLSDFRWPPKYLGSLERHANRGWKSWVQSQTLILAATDLFGFTCQERPA